MKKALLITLGMTAMAAALPCSAVSDLQTISAARNQCDTLVKEAATLMAASESVLKRDPSTTSSVEFARGTAAATLGLLKVQYAERLGCPPALPGDIVRTLNAAKQL